jgi:hypothetical protein
MQFTSLYSLRILAEHHIHTYLRFLAQIYSTLEPKDPGAPQNRRRGAIVGTVNFGQKGY